MTISTLFIGFVALFVGAGIGYLSRSSLVKQKVKLAEERAEKILREAKTKEQEVLLEARERSIQILDDGKREANQIRQESTEMQKRLAERESKFDKQLMDLENRKSQLEQKNAELDKLKDVVEETKLMADIKLEEIAGLSKTEAKNELMTIVEADEKDALLGRIRKLNQHSDEEVEREANKIISLAVARFASSHVTDATTTMVELPSDDMKGRIIGKEGRNIKRIEHLTGCEIIIDDTPGMVMISGFSPVRRQVAKRAMESLMKDGRIQPARIEEAVNDAKKDLAKEMKKAGEDALYEIGIPVSSVDPKLVSILGRLKFRTSYGQNVLQHSIEVSRISGMLAEELGADVTLCKKGGLFHDIGKAVDHDMQGAHPEIGYNIMKKFGWSEELAYQSIAHHEDKPKTIEGVIVKAADAISGARPGARRNSIEQYLQRLQDLEDTASKFPGVDKAYAIQAGREIRVFINPTEVDDYAAYKLAGEIAKKIESDLTYPGEVKVTIIRETRVTEYAR
ncbi:ribonuclease Y [Candidatus Uhrbacteria bacterium CG_4_10_14_0_2_um_filter_41_7]|uniref:Ribonuclease Y n=1 Tax=Candidatus Uhrbacteria bacterium CG_4_9_14_3_um_filter_41_35 TaxID=1975034 RepID=A0A2M7XDW8_9BACT|nr:MAG: ribonuclease Y [Candidatus Uhrbacteria bacterium CG11_big_fil_rev_8_21_14_0_20_41_9]PIZ53771.1 MAG: ribonuclease Y [Candidatus Uhrbacteria bacterium CG_4_10_14_0_2_um_filter_41_7]PJA46074.1 MAG: ribonuclease Y [Candidatus Uhrbacteria bacterium CG_4_9_14_3_um_filter_41_35]